MKFLIDSCIGFGGIAFAVNFGLAILYRTSV